MAVLNLPKATEHLGLFKHERWPRGAKARTSNTLMTSGHTSQTAGRLIRVFIYIYVFLLPVVIFSPPARSLQLTLTADSVKNNSVKLSIKFMVLGESKSKKNRQPSLWNPKRTNSGDLSSNNNKYNNTSGPAKTCLHEGQGGVMANPCWSRGRSIQSFAHNFSPFSFCFAVVVPSFFFFLQLLPMIFRISRNTRIQDAERLTFFRSRPLFSCKAIAIHITKIIPCLLRQPSPSVCPLEEKKKRKRKRKLAACSPMCNLNPWTRMTFSVKENRAEEILVPRKNFLCVCVPGLRLPLLLLLLFFLFRCHCALSGSALPVGNTTRPPLPECLHTVARLLVTSSGRRLVDD